MNARDIKAKIDDYARAYPGEPLNKGQRGSVLGAMNKALASPGEKATEANARRRIVLAYLFGGPLGAPSTAISSTQLSDPQWYALYQWVGFWNDPVEGWMHDPQFDVEVGAVYAEALAIDRQRMESFLGEGAWMR